MKQHKLVIAAVNAFNLLTDAETNRFNAFELAWNTVKPLGWTPKEFRDSVLAAYDANPWVSTKADATENEIYAAQQRKRNSLSSSLTQIMPRIDDSVSWQFRASGGGNKSALAKVGIGKPQVKIIRDALAATSLTPEQIVEILKKLGI
jgi:hypothetical protein